MLEAPQVSKTSSIHYEAPSKAEVTKVYKDRKSRFKVTNEGPLNEYLGVKVERRQDQSMKLSQPLLTQQILDEMGYNYRTKGRSTPALSSQILDRDVSGEQKLTSWHYMSILGKLNSKRVQVQTWHMPCINVLDLHLTQKRVTFKP